jgi:MFS family permease
MTPSEIARDTWLLFAARAIRLFAYGALSVVLVFYLIAIGLTEAETGVLLTLTLLGDTAVSALIGTQADRVGRRRMLILGALLMTAAGLVFVSTSQFVVLLIAATIGVISPSGQEVGPFLPIEQAALSAAVGPRRTEFFAWYTLIGSVASALGALAAGFLTRAAESTAVTHPAVRYRPVVVLYAGLGLLLALLFAQLSPKAESSEENARREPPSRIARHLGLGRSSPVVMRLSALFALDAFGGGFIAQGFAAYWFYLRFGADPALLGPIFFVANLLSGASALVAARLAARFGLIRTMVWTHLPSNVLLILIPLMPTLPLAVALLFLRFSISQMDVPTRQSYVMAVVEPGERSAAGAITGVARTIGAAVSPVLVGVLFSVPALVNWPYFIAGTLKAGYDLLLYRAFKSVSVDDHEGRG